MGVGQSHEVVPHVSKASEDLGKRRDDEVVRVPENVDRTASRSGQGGFREAIAQEFLGRIVLMATSSVRVTRGTEEGSRG